MGEYWMDFQQIEKIARTHMLDRKIHNEREPGWIFYHGLRTAGIAEELCSLLRLEINSDVVFVSSLFHDIGKGNEPHNETGADLTKTLLAEYFPGDKLEQICQVIRLHNQRTREEELPPEVKIVQDADLLDHAGPIQAWLTFYWSGTHNETIKDHIRFITGEENLTWIKKLRGQLNFDVSVAMYDERIRWQDRFFKTFRKVYFEGVWHADSSFSGA
jgi:uncharacterized protein